MDLSKLDDAARAYFESLTPAMKESIMQTGAKLTTKNDLERFVQHSVESLPGVRITKE
ncbi:MAG: hypothetical protein ACI4GO_06540 [Hominenteromicrobium sp.]